MKNLFLADEEEEEKEDRVSIIRNLSNFHVERERESGRSKEPAEAKKILKKIPSISRSFNQS